MINTGTLTFDFDTFALKECIKAAKKFVTAPTWKDYINDVAPALEDNATDSEPEDYIRSSVIMYYYLVGTAAMAAPNAGYGVANPDLRVKGVKGLRIADASIFVSLHSRLCY